MTDALTLALLIGFRLGEDRIAGELHAYMKYREREVPSAGDPEDA